MKITLWVDQIREFVDKIINGLVPRQFVAVLVSSPSLVTLRPRVCGGIIKRSSFSLEILQAPPHENHARNDELNQYLRPSLKQYNYFNM